MRRNHLLPLLAVTSCVALGLAADAQAQVNPAQIVPGHAINRFDPSERGSRWFTLDSLDYGQDFRPTVGVVGDFGFNQLRLYDVNGERQNVVERQTVFHVGATVSFLQRIRLGLSLPIYADSAGSPAQRFDGRYRAAGGSGPGDLRVGLDGLLVGGAKDAFRLGLGARLWLPTGNQDKYTGDGAVAFQFHADVAGDVGPFVYAVRGGYMYRGYKNTVGPTPVGDNIPWGASIGLKVADDALVIGPEVQGAIEISDTGPIYYKKNVFPTWGLLGGHYQAGDFQFGLGAGAGLSHGTGTAAFRGLASVEWVPAAAAAAPPKPVDSDGDGIADANDACPNVVGVPNEDPKKNGCPGDQDGDGIPDAKDACPDIAGVESAEPAKNGCPPDSDNDGIADNVDACPDVAGVKNEDPKKNGCPADKDGDGVADAVDACPDVAGIASDDPKKNGCPPDTDGDGIVDAEDACPKDIGPRNDDPKKNGCPTVIVADGQIKIFEQVKFKTNSAEILKDSDSLLDAVAKTLTDHVEIQKVRIEGHTDNVGKPAANKALSKKRAQSVMNALVKRKIDKKRMVVEGFGQDRPIDSADTEEGRQNNRRVEFHIVDMPPKK
jgi:outer membrane protein OmpA-like peptidoglycan-associated protein